MPSVQLAITKVVTLRHDMGQEMRELSADELALHDELVMMLLSLEEAAWVLGVAVPSPTMEDSSSHSYLLASPMEIVTSRDVSMAPQYGCLLVCGESFSCGRLGFGSSWCWRSTPTIYQGCATSPSPVSSTWLPGFRSYLAVVVSLVVHPFQ